MNDVGYKHNTESKTMHAHMCISIHVHAHITKTVGKNKEKRKKKNSWVVQGLLPKGTVNP